MPLPDRVEDELNWLYSFKKRIISIIVVVLAGGIILTMILISFTLRDRLMEDNLALANKVSGLLLSSLKHLMITGDPALLQNTFEEMSKSDHFISSMFIIDTGGRIVYSSKPEDLGKTIDRSREPSCLACHKTDKTPSELNTVTYVDHESVQRVISLIHNEKSCFRCHPQTGEVIGKLIIDRSMQSTSSLIRSVNIIMFAGGILCLVLLVPLSSNIISRGVNKYISEIMKHNNELKVLYLVVERLSKTLDIKELRSVVIDIIRNTFNATRLTVVTPGEIKEYHAVQWDEGSAVSRKHVGKTDDDYPFINSWLNGTMNDPVILRDKGKLFLPIIKRNTPLALIIMEDGRELFEQVRMNLIRRVSDHIAIAFENARLYHIAITDELTHLYTQRFFRTSVEKQFLQFEAYGEKMALLLIDIDNFKMINDSYGHVAGDSVLKNFSQVLLSAVRENDLAFRYGGEEFTVILPSTDKSGALVVAERIRKEVEGTIFEADDVKLRISVSIGISICPDHAVSVKDLIMKADRSLYAAKQSGKNKVIMST